MMFLMLGPISYDLCPLTNGEGCYLFCLGLLCSYRRVGYH